MSEKERMLAERLYLPFDEDWAETTRRLGCSQGYSTDPQRSSKSIERLS